MPAHLFILWLLSVLAQGSSAAVPTGYPTPRDTVVLANRVAQLRALAGLDHRLLGSRRLSGRRVDGGRRGAIRRYGRGAFG